MTMIYRNRGGELQVVNRSIALRMKREFSASSWRYFIMVGRMLTGHAVTLFIQPCVIQNLGRSVVIGLNLWPCLQSIERK